MIERVFFQKQLYGFRNNRSTSLVITDLYQTSMKLRYCLAFQKRLRFSESLYMVNKLECNSAR